MVNRVRVCPKCGASRTDNGTECEVCGAENVALDYTEIFWGKAEQSQRDAIVRQVMKGAATKGAMAEDADREKPEQPTETNESYPDNVVQGSQSSYAPLALGLAGAVLFVIAGVQMLGIASVASHRGDGGSISEAFCHAMGWFSFGMAFVSATLGYLGWKR